MLFSCHSVFFICTSSCKSNSYCFFFQLGEKTLLGAESIVKFEHMSRRPVNPSRRFGDSGGGGLFAHSKSRSSPILYVGLIVLVRTENRFYRSFIKNNVTIFLLLLFFFLGFNCLKFFFSLLW